MKKSFIITCLLSPLLSLCQQKDCWKMYMNNKKIVSGMMEEPKAVSITFLPKSVFKIQYQCPIEEGWKRQFIIMNEARANLLSKYQNDTKEPVTFYLESIMKATENKQFYVYTVATPSDSSLAMAIRIKPILLCSFNWK